MKIRVKNLGVLKEAEFELGDMTILCGENNTGKTYATYALYGFLTKGIPAIVWRPTRTFPSLDKCATDLMQKGEGNLNITECMEETEHVLRGACLDYTKMLPQIFASSKDKLENAEFSISVNKEDIFLPSPFNWGIRLGESSRIFVSKSETDSAIKLSLIQTDFKDKFHQNRIKIFVYRAVIQALLDSVIPKAFIASAERTGAAIFRNELNFARSHLLEKMTAEEIKDPRELLYSAYEYYPLPVRDNVEFTGKIESISRRNSFLAEKHQDVLNDFADIIGGDYLVHKNQGVWYRPKDNKSVRLSISESSSAVRSLLDIGFYLHHVAQPGNMLMVDEPELNLHPENQRRVARLFARLVNLGMKVFITTHSDYIIKELNALIMLNQDKPHLKKIAKREGYKNKELLSSEKVRLYTAEKNLIMLEGHKRRSRCQTLVRANITEEEGIEATTFDKTINKMNEVEEEILWGGD